MACHVLPVGPGNEIWSFEHTNRLMIMLCLLCLKLQVLLEVIDVISIEVLDLAVPPIDSQLPTSIP